MKLKHAYLIVCLAVGLALPAARWSAGTNQGRCLALALGFHGHQ